MHTPVPNTALRAPIRTASACAVLLALTAMVSLGACSSVPARNAALDQAQSHYDAARTQTQVRTLAPEELQRAGEALRVADQARMNGDTLSAVDHLAYLADQRVSIAQDAAATRAAEAVTAGAAAERDRMRLAQRTQEADSAQRQLATAQQTNAATSQQLAASQKSQALTSAQLAAADMQTQDARNRLARRDAQLGDLQMQLQALNAQKTERGVVVTLGDLLFSTGQARLQGDGERAMTKLAEFFKRNPQRSAAIEGYTDSVGSEASNQALSDRRAHAVMDALVALGVPAQNLRSEGYGPSRPVAANDTAGGRQKNRRVEVVFAPEAGDVLVK